MRLSISACILFVLCASIVSMAGDGNSHLHGRYQGLELLNRLYLSQFIADDLESGPSAWIVDYKNAKVSEKYLAQQSKQSIGLTPFESRTYLINAFSNFFAPSSIGANYDIAHQLQVFQTTDAPHLYEKIFPTQTNYLGEAFGALMLVNGATSNLDTINERQEVIQFLVKNKAIRKELLSIAAQVAPLEKILLEFLKKIAPGDMDTNVVIDTTDQIYLEDKARSYWPLMKEPGTAPNMAIQEALPAIGISAYLSYWWSVYNTPSPPRIIGPMPKPPGYISRFFSGAGNLFYYYVQIEGLAQIGTSMVEKHTASQERDRALTEKLLGVRTLVSGLETISQKDIPDMLRPTIGAKYYIALNRLEGYLKTIEDQKGGHLFHLNLLRAKAAEKLLQEIGPGVSNLLRQIAEIDFYASVAEAVANNPDHYSYVTFLESERPEITFMDLRNPLLGFDSVPNSLQLGQQETQNVILTGGNASGKSTLMRATGINIYHMAMTLGLGSCKLMAITPFSSVQIFMENHDILGKSSSYQSEVDRIATGLEHHQQASDEAEHAFLLVDEILSSTNAVDALTGSKRLLKEFVALPNTLSIISTHLHGLPDLAKEHPELLRNMHMAKGFKWTTGENTQTNALELLEDAFCELGSES